MDAQVLPKILTKATVWMFGCLDTYYWDMKNWDYLILSLPCSYFLCWLSHNLRNQLQDDKHEKGL